METLLQDLRYSGRMLLKHPGFTLIAVLTLGLGIGANTAIFSIVNAVLLRPFPYHAPEQLVMIGENRSGQNNPVSYPDFVDWRDQNNVFESVSAIRSNESYNLTGTNEPERLQGRLVSAGFLSLLGIKPALGRDFVADPLRRRIDEGDSLLEVPPGRSVVAQEKQGRSERMMGLQEVRRSSLVLRQPVEPFSQLSSCQQRPPGMIEST